MNTTPYKDIVELIKIADTVKIKKVKTKIDKYHQCYEYFIVLKRGCVNMEIKITESTSMKISSELNIPIIEKIPTYLEEREQEYWTVQELEEMGYQMY